ncbi:MAG: helix-turn-helix transcriptional regulator [Lentisphaeria bacterium]|jgi:y4mF family transcriptional regulator|nr:helix-turn-helix transcriptional regulator [Lentisphaeria bacterium]MDY0175664.1 helix-turn-helix transcriptional regulator [Lentisphaeria bacterium]NLZ59329.1 helix-turn-helix transcriptional regulator [Lentisphaerota bacterium]
MHLSTFVRHQRKLHGMTQRQLAVRAGVGLRFIRELEADKPTLRMDKVNVVLDLFGHELRASPQQKLNPPPSAHSP